MCLRSEGEGGITQTSDPVSTKNRVPEVRSWTYNRRLGRGPAALVAASDRPGCLTPVCRVPYTSGRHLQRCDDTNRGYPGVNSRHGQG